jgi:hypothetical protein
MRKLTALALACLAGCATTTSDVRQIRGTIVESARSEEDLVRCFVDTMAAFGTPVVIPHSVSFRWEGATVLLIDMEPREGGTRLTVRRVTFHGVPRQVRECL